MNDDFRNNIKRLRDVYNYLTEGEPTPDEEEESQKEMITLLESLIMHIPPENMEENLELLKTSLNMTKEWDTLEFWFKEKPDLVTNVKLILNRFLIRHAETDVEEKPTPKIPLKNGVPDELSTQLAAALDRAMKNLPPDADVTKVIQSVTSQVTESYNASPPASKTQVGLGGVPISTPVKAEPSKGKSLNDESNMPHNTDSFNSTAARVKIRKEDIMKSVLEQVKNNISDSPSSNKLAAPKIMIPKVTKPKQKIVPYEETAAEITATDQKQQELETIPPMQPQDKPKTPPKLKISAFKKDKFLDQQIKTQAPTQPQQPIRPKVIVKPRIKTEVEEVERKKVHSLPEPPIKPQVKEEPHPITPPPQAQKPKIKVQAKPVSLQKQQEIPKEPTNESAIHFNVVKPTKTSVKDTQIDLFETFTKQEKTGKRRKSKKNPINFQIPDDTSSQSQDGKESPTKSYEFPEETIPYEKMDKAQLYQELIALEGKKYAIEKSRKDFKAKHEKGLISDGNYAAQLDRFKYDLQYISKKINEIRQRIQTL